MVDRSAIRRRLFNVGRILFGSVLGFMGLNGLASHDLFVERARSKNVPNAGFLVPFSHGMLAFGGWSIALWRRPVVGAGAVATFFIGVTPWIHDFWNMEDDQRQQHMYNFLRNTAILGAAITFLVRGSE